MDNVKSHLISLTDPSEEEGNQPLELAAGRCPSGGGGGGRGPRGGRGRGINFRSVLDELEKLSNGMFLSLKEVTR